MLLLLISLSYPCLDYVPLRSTRITSASFYPPYFLPYPYFIFPPLSSQMFSPVERFALLISALCHDVDHPGNSNIFQANARTELALLYNDQSILENHHCRIMFKLLLKPSNNFTVNLSVRYVLFSHLLFLLLVYTSPILYHPTFIFRI